MPHHIFKNDIHAGQGLFNQGRYVFDELIIALEFLQFAFFRRGNVRKILFGIWSSICWKNWGWKDVQDSNLPSRSPKSYPVVLFLSFAQNLHRTQNFRDTFHKPTSYIEFWVKKYPINGRIYQIAVNLRLN